MAKSSKVSVAFSSDPSGLEAGIRRAQRAFNGLKTSTSTLERSMESLKRSVNVNSFITAFGSISRVAQGLAVDFKSVWQNSAAGIDALAKLGDASGRTYTEMKSLELAGKLAGTSVETLSKALSKSDQAFFEASAGSASAVEAFRRIGLGVEQLAGLSSAERFAEIAEAIGRLPTPAARTAASMKLLGEEAQGLANFFQAGSGAMREATAYVEELGLGLTELEVESVEKMNDAFTKAFTIIGSVTDKITAQLSPVVTSLVSKFEQLAKDAGGADNIGKRITDGILDGLELLAPTADLIVDGFNSMWKFGRESMGSVIENVKDAIAGLAVVSGGFGLAFRTLQGFGTGAGVLGLDLAIRRNELMLAQAQQAGDQAAVDAAQKWLVELREQRAVFGNALDDVGQNWANNVDLIVGAAGEGVAAIGGGVKSDIGAALRAFREERDRAEKEAEANRKRAADFNAKFGGGDGFGALFADGAANMFREAGGVFAQIAERARDVVGAVGQESAKVVQQAGREMSLAVGTREASNYVARYLAGTGDPKEKVAKQQLDVQDRILKFLEDAGLDLGVVAIQK